MLNTTDLQMLKDSGISNEVIEARGYQSIAKGDCELYGFDWWQCRDGLLVPLWGTDGHIKGHQLRAYEPRIKKGSTKPIKYETPSGQGNFLDINPLMLDLVKKNNQVIWITEGAKKSDSLASIGIPCISLKGVWGWRGTNEHQGKTAVGDWEDISIKGNPFVIAFDNDIHTNYAVLDAMHRLRKYLISRGAEPVGTLMLPYDPENKMGVDDYIALVRSGHGK